MNRSSKKRLSKVTTNLLFYFIMLLDIHHYSTGSKLFFGSAGSYLFMILHNTYGELPIKVQSRQLCSCCKWEQSRVTVSPTIPFCLIVFTYSLDQLLVWQYALI